MLRSAKRKQNQIYYGVATIGSETLQKVCAIRIQEDWPVQ